MCQNFCSVLFDFRVYLVLRDIQDPFCLCLQLESITEN